VLDGLDEIKIAVAYKLNGKVLEAFPSRLVDLALVEVEYETLPGWNQSLKDVTSWKQLPDNARKYVERLEELLSCPIKYVGVGQRRDQLIVRS
jgi:adenylosuccinate synthase